MTWEMFNRVQLHRLLTKLRHQQRFFQDVADYLNRYNFPPTDPLAVETRSAINRTADFIDTVEEMIKRFPPPYRPLIDPYRTSGSRAHVRADFKIRGIQQRPPYDGGGSR